MRCSFLCFHAGMLACLSLHCMLFTIQASARIRPILGVLRQGDHACTQLRLQSAAPFNKHPSPVPFGSFCQIRYAVESIGSYAWQLTYGSDAVIRDGARLRVVGAAGDADPARVMVRT